MADNEIKKGVKYNKNRGCLYEQLFMYESLKRDLIPHKPILDPTCHDLVVVTPEGCPAIVQVKSITARSYDNRKEKKGSFKYAIKTTCNTDKTMLKDSYVDILAVFCTREDTWYVIPCHKLKGRTIGLYPHIEGSTGGYESFKNRWESFSDDQVCPPN